MAQVMKSHIVRAGLGSYGIPVVLEIRQWHAGFLTSDHPWISRHPLDGIKYRSDGPGQRNHSRAGFRVPEPQLVRRVVNIVPTQRQNLRHPASGEQQEPNGRKGGSPDGAVRLHLAQRLTHATELLRREKPLSRTFPIEAQKTAGIVPGGNQFPCLSQREHRRQELHDPVGCNRCLTKSMMQCRDVATANLGKSHLTEIRKDMVVEHAAVLGDGTRVAMHLHVNPHEPFGQVAHGRCRRGPDILSTLDSVDDDGCSLPRLSRGDIAVTCDADTLQSGRPSGLYDVDLPACGVDTNTESSQVSIPEQAVPFVDGEGIDGTLGELDLASSGHNRSPWAALQLSDAIAVREMTFSVLYGRDRLGPSSPSPR